MSIKQKVEDNIVVFFLGALLTGFTAGLGAYKFALEIAKMDLIPKDELARLQDENKNMKAELSQQRGAGTKSQSDETSPKTKAPILNKLSNSPSADAADNASQTNSSDVPFIGTGEAKKSFLAIGSFKEYRFNANSNKPLIFKISREGDFWYEVQYYALNGEKIGQPIGWSDPQEIPFTSHLNSQYIIRVTGTGGKGYFILSVSSP